MPPATGNGNISTLDKSSRSDLDNRIQQTIDTIRAGFNDDELKHFVLELVRRQPIVRAEIESFVSASLRRRQSNQSAIDKSAASLSSINTPPADARIDRSHTAPAPARSGEGLKTYVIMRHPDLAQSNTTDGPFVLVPTSELPDKTTVAMTAAGNEPSSERHPSSMPPFNVSQSSLAAPATTASTSLASTQLNDLTASYNVSPYAPSQPPDANATQPRFVEPSSIEPSSQNGGTFQTNFVNYGPYSTPQEIAVTSPSLLPPASQAASNLVPSKRRRPNQPRPRADQASGSGSTTSGKSKPSHNLEDIPRRARQVFEEQAPRLPKRITGYITYISGICKDQGTPETRKEGLEALCEICNMICTSFPANSSLILYRHYENSEVFQIALSDVIFKTNKEAGRVPVYALDPADKGWALHKLQALEQSARMRGLTNWCEKINSVVSIM